MGTPEDVAAEEYFTPPEAPWEKMVSYQCVCSSYDRTPLQTGDEICHCYECDAYNWGKQAQAKLTWQPAYDQGFADAVNWVKEHSEIIRCDPDVEPYFASYLWIDLADWEALKLHLSKRRG